MSARRWKGPAAGAALCVLILYGLTSAGLVGPDEPRYASIGREMARSGDWTTPSLWGEAWFEKPPLVYWLTALGYLVGLGPELAPRLPVALVSLAFLVFYFRELRGQFGARAAGIATVVLGTSPGWVAFSQVAVPDLPMTAAFSAAMLLGLRWHATGSRTLPALAAGLLGVAVLGKGLVPLVLSLPLIYLARQRWRDWASPAPVLTFAAVTLPWYVACTLRHGSAFLVEFFGRHHLERFFGGETLHPQPFWFYLPVLAAAVIPWTPLLGTLFQRNLYRDPDRRFLLLWLGFGFVFFSASSGKLPGYLLPLLPALAALLGLAVAEARNLRWLLAASAALLLVIPLTAELLPQALAVGLSRSRAPEWNWWWAALGALPAVLVWLLESRGKREAATGVLAAAAAAGILYLKVAALPEVDRLASARPVWRQAESHRGNVCVAQVPRALRYGLNYYADSVLPDCAGHSREWRIERLGRLPPALVRQGR
ncbi:MAG: glycosyltransferase family 39 protein [Bryobacteraceae bacterium]|nr:glycosyltransferase family 39 protein [Bryobacteraceae bacterium]